ncbi:hypothetical protein D3C87_1064260 [compost metagenome]
MKSNVFKIVLPMAVAAFALASAAGTSSLNKKGKAAIIPGYARISSNPVQCAYVADCNEGDDVNCTAPDNVTQLYLEENTCHTPLKRDFQ